MNDTDIPAPPVDPTVAEIRRRVGGWRQAGERIALVPTMGALHDGHIALVNAAKAQADRTVVSIFLNPTQFGPGEDLATYPKTWEADLAALASLGVDAVFAPNVAEVYPDGFATAVTVAGPGLGLETDFRPQFLTGVATVVAKLLIACMPDIAIFGEKDYQQLLVIRRMATDLDIATAIIGAPTVREPDGLAMSSRNAYLTPGERETAGTFAKVLREAASSISAGGDPDAVLARARKALKALGIATVDYLEIRHAETLAPVMDGPTVQRRLFAAVVIGKTRLIDNIAVPMP
jgi:pantoate--beta-alanine ligase